MDFEHGVRARVGYWERGIEEGIQLGSVDHEGYFAEFFSEGEMELLKSGDAWLTLTVGNNFSKASQGDQRLGVESLVSSKGDAVPVVVKEPEYYYGRVEYERGIRQ